MLREICIETNRYVGTLNEGWDAQRQEWLVSCYNQRTEGFYGNQFIHGYEKASQYQGILDKIIGIFLLSCYCKIIYDEAINGIGPVLAHH